MKQRKNPVRRPYQAPKLEWHLWQTLMGISLPIGTSALDNPLEDFTNILPEDKQ